MNSLTAAAGDAGSVLVFDPGGNGVVTESVWELPGADPGDVDVLAITDHPSVERWLRDWHDHAGALPANLSIISLRDVTRSAAAASAGAGSAAGQLISAVDSPGDLEGLADRVTEVLASWDGTGNRSLVYLDALSALLRAVDLRTAFRFLHVLLNRGAEGGAVYVTVDPGAHSHRTLTTLAYLFDAVVELDPSDGWRVQRPTGTA